jgi:multimeric flavodoxin WrbA
MEKNVVILNFSGRNAGNCNEIGEFIKEYHKNANILSCNVGECWNPCGGCDYECLKPGVQCPVLTEQQTQVMDAALAADLIYYIVPNYCGCPTANYYAFNERAVGYFNMDRTKMGQFANVRKKFIIVSNTENPAFALAMQLQSKEPDILYLKTSAYQKKSISGDLLTAEQAQEDLKAFLEKE